GGGRRTAARAGRVPAGRGVAGGAGRRARPRLGHRPAGAVRPDDRRPAARAALPAGLVRRADDRSVPGAVLALPRPSGAYGVTADAHARARALGPLRLGPGVPAPAGMTRLTGPDSTALALPRSEERRVGKE